MNPNDVFILRILGDLEAGAGEPEQAIDHLNQVLRLNPRDTHGHLTYSALAFACFAARRYDEGIRWASFALREAPRMPQAHASLVICLVGAGLVEKAKAAFMATSPLPREFFDTRLNGRWPYAVPDDRTRATTFLRIAAGLENSRPD